MTDKTPVERLTARLLCVTPPDAAQEERMRRFLSQKYGAEVALSIEIDPSLRSGFRLSAGGEVYDWSAEGRLQQFRESVERARFTACKTAASSRCLNPAFRSSSCSPPAAKSARCSPWATASPWWKGWSTPPTAKFCSSSAA